MIRADGMIAATLATADDAPDAAATKIAGHATIHSTANGTAGCRAGSIVVN
jgi:hypothetical protein